MNVRFHDLELAANPLNGTRVDNALALSGLRRALAGREPFMFELRSDRGFTLTIGLAPGCASVRHGRTGGQPPCLMAVGGEGDEGDDGRVEFRAGGTPTPIPARLCVSIEQMETIATDFLADGARSSSVAWERV